MGMFRDWVEKKVDEVQRISPEEERELGPDIGFRTPVKGGIGFGTRPDPHRTSQVTQGGKNSFAPLQDFAPLPGDPPIPGVDFDEDPEVPEAPAPEPFSQARRKAIQSAQKRKPSSQEGQEMARGIRMMNPQVRGQINMVNDKLKSADLATLRRVNAAIDRIVGPEAVLGQEPEI